MGYPDNLIMIKEKKQGFKLLRGTNGESSLYIDSSRLDESIEFMVTHRVKHIQIDSNQGYTLRNLDFLSRIEDFVEGIVIPDDHYTNLEIVNTLHKLKFLGLGDDKKSKVDLSNFPDLETCAVKHSPRLKGLETCKNLKHLTLSNYKSNSNDLSEFPGLFSLESLFLIQAQLKSLNGIGKLNSLKELKLYGISKLLTIEEIGKLSDALEEIEIENCKNISDFDSISNVTSLKKLIITASGEINTLSFLKCLKNLEFISFVGTNILDGDLSYCSGISYVGFNNKKHYSHSFESFKKLNQNCEII
jgi:hypothetical protein